ncbi:Rhs-family protein [Pseudomonas chlororaphis]|uniref:Rhs-family protein n=1 Tax=Pseudomonas chlororaphis TaxID=587753 RepID=A0A3G7TVF9_9PSED|nr:RHS repeat-associated core domain-containing protein [Pseudomonas chlororaphis]AZE50392.1 Rhs-family protein [Pseudomonas chlororaphis]
MSDLAELHQDTPTLMVIGPRGHALRSVSYYRTEAGVTAEARVERQDYDAAGRVIAQWDARLGEEVKNDPRVQANLRMVYSLSGQMLCTDSVDAGRQLSLPGEAGQVVDSWDSKLDHRCIAYDQMLRPVRVYEQAAGQPERRTSECLAYAGPEGASHNQCGQLIRHDDSAGTVHFSEYNLLGAPLEQTRHFLERLEEPDWPAGEVDRDRLLESGTGATTQTGYNAVGEIRSQTDAFGNRQIIYQNVAGQLQETRLKLAGKPEETLVRAISYNAFNQIEQQTAGNGVTTQAIYSALDGRLQQVKTQTLAKAPLQDLNYSYDPLGNITSIKDNAQPIRYFRNQRIEMLNTYKYNTLDQLIEAKGPQAIKGRIGPQLPEFQSPADPNQLEIYTQTFDYDPSGNLDVLRHTAASQNQTRRMGVSKYSNRGLQEKADGSLPTEAEIAAGVDANGNLKVLQPGQTLAWDMRNQLCQVDQVVRDDDAPNDIERYVYDSAGQRQRKIRMAYTGRFSRTHEVRYLPGLEIRTSPGEVLHVISVQAGRSRVEVLHWVEGQPKGIKSNHQQRYSLGDHLGSSTLELDDEAALISQEWFYPYGGTACWAGRDKVEASYKVVRYSGKERDATGLYYYGFRYYAPWLQRWINPDPAGAIDGLNLFRMVRNNPLTLHDPNGAGSKNGVIYVPFSGEDMVDATSGRNISRAMKNKPLFSLIAKDDADQGGLENSRMFKEAHSRQEFTSTDIAINKAGGFVAAEHHLGSIKYQNMMDQRNNHHANATELARLTIKSNAGGQELSKLNPANDKLYIFGHGGAGDNSLDSALTGAKKTVSATELAKQLADGGLPKDFRDFRILACYSADITEPASFNQVDLDIAANNSNPSLSSRARRMVGIIDQSFAQSFANALVNEGFINPQVTGYQAEGRLYSQADHQRRAIGKPGPGQLQSRQSRVKRIFHGIKGGKV